MRVNVGPELDQRRAASIVPDHGLRTTGVTNVRQTQQRRACALARLATPLRQARRLHVENAGIRDMLQDIAIEEFSHLEMVAN